MAVKLTAVTVFSSILASGLYLAGSAMAAPPTPAVANPVLVYLNKAGAIEVSNADGSAKTVLLTNTRTVASHRPTWDSDGAGTEGDPWHIVYESNYCDQLRRFAVWKDDKGGLKTGPNTAILTSVPRGYHCFSAVDISPTANKLVFGNTNEGSPSSLRTMSDDGTGFDEPVYAPSDGSQITWASYNCDGSKIAFVENGTTGDTIRIVKSDGTTPPEQPLQTSGRFLEWSPDGTRLAFSAGGAPSSVEGVWVMDVGDVASKVRLVSGSGASWSPDNSKLAFANAGGVSTIDLNDGTITLLARGAHHPKFRNRNLGCPQQ